MDTKQATSQKSKTDIVLETDKRVAFLRMGTADGSAFTLTEERILSLSKAIASVRASKEIEGLVLVGSDPNIFCAGADLNSIKEITSQDVATKLAQVGQRVFDQLAALPCRTVAAISGACIGGGCELALACDYRVLTDLPATKIGLPEIKLGIIPGFGGTQRLPRLIGLPAALDIILKGRVVSAERAFKIGLADYLVSSEGKESSDDAFGRLLEHKAKEIALGKIETKRRKATISDSLLTHSAMGRMLVAGKVKRQVESSTKGNYPAPPRALEVALYGLKAGMEQGLKKEAQVLGELLVTKESKSLVHIYFLTDETTKRWRNAKFQASDAKVAVIGAGTMGAGIATSMVMSGVSVVLVEPIAATRAKAQSRIESVLEKRRGAKAGKLLQKLSLVESIKAIADVDIVIEAVSENFKLKKKILKDVSQVVGDKTIIASNTSSLPISELVTSIGSTGRIVGMHFFNPAEKMPLVEVVCTKKTDERAIAFTSSLAVSMGKYPVVVHEVPGFLVNRILSPYLLESSFLLKDGFGIEAIDRAAVSFGMPVGPLRLLDEIGLDVAAEVASIIEKSYGVRMAGPANASKLVSSGRLGKKSGAGFYSYRNGKPPFVDDAVSSILGVSAKGGGNGKKQGAVEERLILPMLNEAVRCLDEGVAENPGLEAAGQIDLATVMGLGFAPFRGGILHYAESLGAKVICEKLTALEKECGERFEPCDGIVKRASSGSSFYSKTK